MSRLKALLGDAVLFDMTNILTSPVRTGIQRVTHQMALHWPRSRPLLPFRNLDDERIALLSPDILDHVERFFSAGDDYLQRAAQAYGVGWSRFSEGYHRMLALSRSPLAEVDAVVAARQSRGILSLELSLNTIFYGRLAREAADKVYKINYDYILWLNPEFNTEVDWNEGGNFSEYIGMLRSFPHQAFISTATRNNHLTYIDPGLTGDCPVIVPGTDGLGRERRAEIADKAEYVVIGTIEPRKQHLPIMRAICAVQDEGLDVSLVIIGKLGWLASDDRQEFLDTVAGNDRITWIEAPGDDQLTTILKQARASIFFSKTEGFGGPPVESLSLGTPIIVSDTTPSVLDLPDRGQVRVDPDDQEGLRAAIRFLADPANARAKQAEIADLDLPTWRGFIEGISGWIDRIAPPRPIAQGIRRRIAAFALGNAIAAGSAVEHVVDDLFQLVLRRAPSEEERRTWITFAAEEALTGQAFALAFLRAEHAHAGDLLELLPLLILTDDRLSGTRDGGGPSASLAGARETVASLLMMPSIHRATERVFTDINLRRGSPEEVQGLAAGLAEAETLIPFLLSTFESAEFKASRPGQALSRDDAAAIAAMAPLELIGKMAGADDRKFVAALYRGALDRPVDPEGERHYLGLLAAGESRASVALNVFMSREADTKVTDIDITAGVVQMLAPLMGGEFGRRMAAGNRGTANLEDLAALQLLAVSQADPAALRSAAREILAGHEGGPDADGSDLMRRVAARLPVGRIAGRPVTGALDEIAYRMNLTAAFGEHGTGAFLDAAYRAVLGRPADPSGIAHYARQMDAGLPREEVIRDLAKSTEFEQSGRSADLLAAVLERELAPGPEHGQAPR